MDMDVTFIGNGDSLGTPRVYCDCPVCAEARSTGRNRRYRSSVWLEEEGESPLLLDCGPDWRTQMEALGVRHVPQAIITHAHFDHIGGLVDWADCCRWREEAGLLYAPEEVLGEVRRRFPWLEAQLKMEGNDLGIRYGKWRITPWRVNHGKNGYAYAYRFDNGDSGAAWAYCSDAIALTEAQKAPLAGLKLLVLGTSYAKEPYSFDTRSVYDMEEGLRLAEELAPEAVVFTHLSHDVDAARDYGLPQHVRLAAAGLKLSV